MSSRYYTMKLKGQAGQTDRIQVRDSSFDLLGHFLAAELPAIAQLLGENYPEPALGVFFRELPYHRLIRIQL